MGASGTTRAPGFGSVFSDHMATASYDVGTGWTSVEVVPFRELVLHPAALVFHYGQAIFEGLKAHRQPDGSVALFRPDDNAARFDRSASRLAMPTLPPGAFTDACVRLVAADADHVPHERGRSLYLRPYMIATEIGLGVRPSLEHRFVVIACPAGDYFAGGLRPITVWVTDDYVRAAPGGTGAAKCAGNYAASLAAKAEATARGCDETLFVDALERRWVEELGGMNVVAVGGTAERPVLVAPPVHDTVLDGITRRSLLTLATHLGMEVVERPVSIDELCAPGAFSEAFACGTAAVVVPIGAVCRSSGSWTIGDGGPGPVTTQLREALVALQEGRAPDPFGWRVPVPAAAPA